MCSFFIGLDDLLHKAMTHNVLFREVALRNAVHILEHMQCVYKAAACSLWQVDLGHILSLIHISRRSSATPV